MDEESAAVALDFAHKRIQTIWTTTALSRTEEHFWKNIPDDWDHIFAHAEDFEMIVEYRAQGTDVGPNGYETDYELRGHIDSGALEQDNVDIDEDIARRFADRWAEEIIEVIGETQDETTLSEKEFAAFVTMQNEACTEYEAADALGITIGTYRGKKGRIKSKQQACTNTEIFSRLLEQPTPNQFAYSRNIGDSPEVIEAVTPSDIYRFQIEADERSSLALPREPPSVRRHETYERGHWRTAHIEGIDNVFVADTSGVDYDNVIRIDFDGLGHGGADMHEEGENVQVSAWYTEKQARELQKQLNEKLDS